jgi:hypothetical protein
MSLLNDDARIIFYGQPITMYKSYDGLLTLVLNDLNIELTPNTYVLFVNRDRNQFKMLFFDQGIISIFSMRLSGAMKITFGKSAEFNNRSFRELITNLITRKSHNRYRVSF